MELSDEEFRARLAEVLAHARLSRRGLSQAMGRDPGYIAALLDPSRPSRARPTPADLLRASDATGIAFVELLATLWAIDVERLVEELRGRILAAGDGGPLRHLSSVERAQIADFATFLAERRPPPARRPRR